VIRILFRSLTIATVLTALAAFAASAQDARVAARLDARTAAAVTRVVDSARARSLPTEPLVQKALQGAAKRAASERVLAAVTELLSELTVARAALGQRSTEAELVAGAGALHAGVPAASLSRIRELRGGQSVTVAVGTLADLVARGVPVDGAVGAVLALVERRAADADVIAFSNQVGRDIAAGAPPAVAARVRSRGPGARPATVPGRPDNAAPRGRGRRPTGQGNPGRS
jgi:hypothetical protein